jgi:hypothetical protein
MSLLLLTGLLAEHSQLGLETRRRRHLPGRTQVGIHSPKLLGSGILHHDGQFIRHEIVQNRK